MKTISVYRGITDETLEQIVNDSEKTHYIKFLNLTSDGLWVLVMHKRVQVPPEVKPPSRSLLG